ncbi:MAG: hypothetical protein LBR38_04085 [Synergistaceae bacterium]|jgi:nicotinamidase-related amidase|nr:hypothetical protein [Synergistaceae bacterium]
MSINALFIVDPQNDFCDPKGALYVPGASEDMARLAGYIERHAPSAVFVSLDSHDANAIFHPRFWVNEAGQHPAPFTSITPDDFRAGRWRSVVPCPEAEGTFSAIEAKKIDGLTIWPEHCLVSTWGHQIAAPLMEALDQWRDETGLAVRYVFKGENPFTDQFSVFEGVNDAWPETKFNEALFQKLKDFDSVAFAGEALSHCVSATVASYMKRLSAEQCYANQSVRLLEDCTSPVAGFERGAFVDSLRKMGVE